MTSIRAIIKSGLRSALAQGAATTPELEERMGLRYAGYAAICLRMLEYAGVVRCLGRSKAPSGALALKWELTRPDRRAKGSRQTGAQHRDDMCDGQERTVLRARRISRRAP